MNEVRQVTFRMGGTAVAILISSFAWADGSNGRACEDVRTFTPDKYLVQIDRKTGEAYVKTPCGWRFVRVIERDRIDQAIRIVEQAQAGEGDAVDIAQGGGVLPR